MLCTRFRCSEALAMASLSADIVDDAALSLGSILFCDDVCGEGCGGSVSAPLLHRETKIGD